MQQGHDMQHGHGYAACPGICSMDTACSIDVDTQYVVGHAAWTSAFSMEMNMDMQHVLVYAAVP
jgi:hypothetical protein